MKEATPEWLLDQLCPSSSPLIDYNKKRLLDHLNPIAEASDSAGSNSDHGPQLWLRCDHCGKFFSYNGGKRKRFCSDAHKMAAWRATKQPVAEINGMHIVASPDVPAGEIHAVQPDDLPD